MMFLDFDNILYKTMTPRKPHSTTFSHARTLPFHLCFSFSFNEQNKQTIENPRAQKGANNAQLPFHRQETLSYDTIHASFVCIL